MTSVKRLVKINLEENTREKGGVLVDKTGSFIPSLWGKNFINSFISQKVQTYFNDKLESK